MPEDSVKCSRAACCKVPLVNYKRTGPRRVRRYLFPRLATYSSSRLSADRSIESGVVGLKEGTALRRTYTFGVRIRQTTTWDLSEESGPGLQCASLALARSPKPTVEPDTELSSGDERIRELEAISKTLRPIFPPSQMARLCQLWVGQLTRSGNNSDISHMKKVVLETRGGVGAVEAFLKDFKATKWEEPYHRTSGKEAGRRLLDARRRGMGSRETRNQNRRGRRTMDVKGPRILTLVSNFVLGSLTNGSRASTRQFGEGRSVSEEAEVLPNFVQHTRDRPQTFKGPLAATPRLPVPTLVPLTCHQSEACFRHYDLHDERQLPRGLVERRGCNGTSEHRARVFHKVAIIATNWHRNFHGDLLLLVENKTSLVSTSPAGGREGS
ncbi:hypothetical protein V8E53_000649 [Lactarius tabidus]